MTFGDTMMDVTPPLPCKEDILLQEIQPQHVGLVKVFLYQYQFFIVLDSV